jgi:hydroxymethylpyrimidine pyrophosphatase-like HAD family hydrolase
VKAQWDPTEKKRLHIVSFLKPLLPEFSIGIGGMTSIDVTKKGIDKAFGVRKICEYLKIPISNAVYVGDALFEGGNDYAARASGVECVEVANVKETKKLIAEIINI